MAVPNVQALGPVTDDETFAIPMTIADALGIGWSMQTLAIQGRMPPATAAIYRRIGERMVKLAKAEMQKRVEAAQASGAKATRSRDPQIECPTCCDQVGLNLAANDQPRINTHKLTRGEHAGEVCPSSRTWVSQHMYDAAKARAAK